MHIGPPVTPRLVLVLLRDDVAEADARAAVQTLVGLLVDAALAVGVRRDEVGGEAVRLDGLGLDGRRGREGSRGETAWRRRYTRRHRRIFRQGPRAGEEG